MSIEGAREDKYIPYFQSRVRGIPTERTSVIIFVSSTHRLLSPKITSANKFIRVVHKILVREFSQIIKIHECSCILNDHPCQQWVYFFQ